MMRAAYRSVRPHPSRFTTLHRSVRHDPHASFSAGHAPRSPPPTVRFLLDDRARVGDLGAASPRQSDRLVARRRPAPGGGVHLAPGTDAGTSAADHPAAGEVPGPCASAPQLRGPRRAESRPALHEDAQPRGDPPAPPDAPEVGAADADGVPEPPRIT